MPYKFSVTASSLDEEAIVERSLLPQGSQEDPILPEDSDIDNDNDNDSILCGDGRRDSFQ